MVGYHHMETRARSPVWTPANVVPTEAWEEEQPDLPDDLLQAQLEVERTGTRLIHTLRRTRGMIRDHLPQYQPILIGINKGSPEKEIPHAEDPTIIQKIEHVPGGRMIMMRIEDILRAVPCLSWKERGLRDYIREDDDHKIFFQMGKILRYIRYVRHLLEQNPVVEKLLMHVSRPTDAYSKNDPSDAHVMRMTMMDKEALASLLALERLFSQLPRTVVEPRLARTVVRLRKAALQSDDSL